MPPKLPADCVPGIAFLSQPETKVSKVSAHGWILEEFQQGGCNARDITGLD